MAAACRTEAIPGRKLRRSWLITVSSALLLAGLCGLPNSFVGGSASSVDSLPQTRRSAGSAQGISLMDREDMSEDFVDPAGEYLLQAQSKIEAKLQEAEARLKRAQAFKLPEADSLQLEVQSLQLEAKKLADQLAKVASLTVVEGTEEVEEQVDEVEPLPGAPTKLSEKLSWEKFEAMSNEERFSLTQEVGPAFGLSVAIVALCYWSITLPILLNAYHESTGEWPRVEEIFSLSDGGKAAGAVAGILGLAALLKPLRIAAAIALTPWTADNVLPFFPWLSQSSDKQEDGAGKA